MWLNADVCKLQHVWGSQETSLGSQFSFYCGFWGSHSGCHICTASTFTYWDIFLTPYHLSIIYVFAFYLFLCVWVFCLNVYWYTMCVLCPQRPEGRRSSKWLWGPMWVLGMEPGFCRQTVSVLNYCSLQLPISLLKRQSLSVFISSPVNTDRWHS